MLHTVWLNEKKRRIVLRRSGIALIQPGLSLEASQELKKFDPGLKVSNCRGPIDVKVLGGGAFKFMDYPGSILTSDPACVAALIRIALGSATAAILTASALVATIAKTMPGMESLLVLSVACGVTVGTQPADSGFWMIKEYGNLSPRDVMVRVNLCRFLMALLGLGVLLIVEVCWQY